MNHIFMLLQFTIVSNYNNHKQLTKSHCEKPSAVQKRSFQWLWRSDAWDPGGANIIKGKELHHRRQS